MARNTGRIRRGWSYDIANSRLQAYVDGLEAIRLTASTTGVDVRLLGDTPATNYINFDASGPTLTLAGSVGVDLAGGGIDIGSSGSEISYTAGTPLFTLYATNAGTSGSTSAEPFYVYSVLTGTGQVGGRSRFHAYSNVTSGGWLNALKAYMEFGSSGKTTGLASAMCVEMKMPNANMGSGGAYYPLEIEYVAGGTSLVTAGSPTGNQAGFIYMAQSGDADGDFDDNGFLFYLNGCTAGSGHLYDTTANAATGDATLKINVGGATKYLLIADDAS